MIQTQGPIVILQSGPPEWWEILGAFGPLAVLLSAGVAGFFAWKSLRQTATVQGDNAKAAAIVHAENVQAELRSQWWSRVQWALDASLSSDPARQKAGNDMIRAFLTEDRVPNSDIEALDAAWEDPLKRAAERLGIDTSPVPVDNENQDDTREELRND